jgi:hypothetical protein
MSRLQRSRASRDELALFFLALPLALVVVAVLDRFMVWSTAALTTLILEGALAIVLAAVVVLALVIGLRLTDALRAEGAPALRRLVRQVAAAISSPVSRSIG